MLLRVMVSMDSLAAREQVGNGTVGDVYEEAGVGPGDFEFLRGFGGEVSFVRWGRYWY